MTKTIGPTQYPQYVDETPKTTLCFYNVQYDEIQPGDQYGYKIIMTIDNHSRTWWATRGLTFWEDGYVRDHGDKISETAALELFPMMKHLTYYYRD